LVLRVKTPFILVGGYQSFTASVFRADVRNIGKMAGYIKAGGRITSEGRLNCGRGVTCLPRFGIKKRLYILVSMYLTKKYGLTQKVSDSYSRDD
jgi:hypothetical protein